MLFKHFIAFVVHNVVSIKLKIPSGLLNNNLWVFFAQKGSITSFTGAVVMTTVKFQNKSLCLPTPMTTWTTEESWLEAGGDQSRDSSSFRAWTYSDQHTAGSQDHYDGKQITSCSLRSQNTSMKQVQPLSVAVFFFRTLFRWSRCSETPVKTWSTSSAAQKVLARSEKHNRTNSCDFDMKDL